MAEAPADSSIDDATAAAVSPAMSFARHAHRLASELPGRLVDEARRFADDELRGHGRSVSALILDRTAGRWSSDRFVRSSTAASMAALATPTYTAA